MIPVLFALHRYSHTVHCHDMHVIYMALCHIIITFNVKTIKDVQSSNNPRTKAS